MSKELATFAAGCFWGVEKAFQRKFSGLGITTRVGYIGGRTESPNYKQVCSGTTGHAEALEIGFDPSKLEYKTLVDFFYRMHDPTTANRQGNDVGTQYRSAIFYHNEEQKKVAEEVTLSAKTYFGNKEIRTTFEPAGNFYPAEEYHQDYLTKNPHGYECASHYERTWDQIKEYCRF